MLVKTVFELPTLHALKSHKSVCFDEGNCSVNEVSVDTKEHYVDEAGLPCQLSQKTGDSARNVPRHVGVNCSVTHWWECIAHNAIVFCDMYLQRPISERTA